MTEYTSKDKLIFWIGLHFGLAAMAEVYGKKPLHEALIFEMLEKYRDYYAHDITNDELIKMMDDWQEILNDDTKLMKAVVKDKIRNIFEP